MTWYAIQKYWTKTFVDHYTVQADSEAEALSKLQEAVGSQLNIPDNQKFVPGTNKTVFATRTNLVKTTPLSRHDVMPCRSYFDEPFKE